MAEDPVWYRSGIVFLLVRGRDELREFLSDPDAYTVNGRYNG